MPRGNKLYIHALTGYVRGEDLKGMRANVNQLNALLRPNGLQPILQEAELLALESYLRNLPMAYATPLHKHSRRSPPVFDPLSDCRGTPARPQNVDPADAADGE